MAAIEFTSLALAVGALIVRLTSETSGADSIGDAQNAFEGAFKLGKKFTPRNPLLAEIQAHLKASTQRYGLTEQEEQDLYAASLNVADLFKRLADEPDAVWTVVVRPEQLHGFVMQHGGRQLLARTEEKATPFTEQLIDTCGRLLTDHVAHSSRFTANASIAMLRRQDSLQDGQEELKSIANGLHAKTDQVLANSGRVLELLQAGQPSSSITAVSASQVHHAIRQQQSTIREALIGRLDTVIRREKLTDAATRADGFPIAFLGEGGAGKSVLAAEIFASAFITDKILVSCAVLDGADRIATLDEIDLALGRQATDLPLPLSTALNTFDNPPLLIVDTLDLVLREETASEVARLLRQWSQRSQLVVTCREREWDDLIAGRHLNLNLHRMPSLTGPEVLQWSERYLSDMTLEEDLKRRFAGSLEAILSDRRSLTVLGNPLRLHMATRLYAEDGELPDGLSATRLYQEYWSGRVSTARDGSRNTIRTRAIESTALLLARGIWDQSLDRFAEDVYYNGELAPLLKLRSEGIVVARGHREHFFHQTFAEFAVARSLAMNGGDDDFSRLHDGLLKQRSGYWGIANHLVREDLAADRFFRIVRSIPASTVEGTRIVLEGMWSRNDHPEISREVAETLHRLHQENPGHLAAAADILQDAPALTLPAVGECLCALISVASSDLTMVVRAVGTIIRREDQSKAPQLLECAMQAISERWRSRDQLALAESRRLIEAVFAGQHEIDPGLFRTAIKSYRAFPAPGRGAVIAAVRRTDQQSLRSALLEEALKCDPTPDSVEDLAEMLAEELMSPTSSLEWQCWQDVATAKLTSTLWVAVRVRLIAHLARNRDVLAEIVAEAITPSQRISRECIVKSLTHVARANPGRLAEVLTQAGVPAERSAAAAFAKVCRELVVALQPETRVALLDKLEGFVDLCPQEVWAAVSALNAHDADSIQTTLIKLELTIDEAEQPQTLSTAFYSSLDALTQAAPANALAPHLRTIERIAQKIGGLNGDHLGFLLGLISSIDDGARYRIDEIIDSDQKQAQKSIVTALQRNRDQWSVERWNASLPWFVSLLRMHNDSAVIELAKELTNDAAGPSWTQALTDAVVERLLLALRNGCDTQVSLYLLKLLRQATRANPLDLDPDESQTQRILSGYRRALIEALPNGDSSRRTSYFSQYIDALTQLAMKTLGHEAVARSAQQLLSDVNIAPLGRKAVKPLSRLLQQVLLSSPTWWGRFEQMWAEIPIANREAVAKTALSGIVPDGEAAAERFARRPDCPSDVAAEIHRRLRK